MSQAGPPAATLRLGSFAEAVERRLEQWRADDFVERLWAGDHRLWSPEPVPELTDRLGWLRLPESAPEGEAARGRLADAVTGGEVDDILLFGMGGSSLAPEVFQRALGNEKGHPPLSVLDTTHPDAVAGVARSIDPARTFCVVSSKSGGTIETLSLFRFFWSLIEGNTDRPGDRFAAITDPGSSLEALGAERGFLAVVPSPPDVGGRYSALSPFGLVPAALIGADVDGLIGSASVMSEACRRVEDNPGLILGAALGELARAGRDKLTLLTPPALDSFPDWLEQLIAESTGKDGTGIVPIAGETPGPPDSYGADRVFVALSLGEGDEGGLSGLLADLAEAGHPTIEIRMRAVTELGGEMYRWEVATAAACSVLEVNPFDQENVQLAKSLAKRAMAGELDGADAGVEEIAVGDPELAGAVGRWLASASEGDYLCLQAYLPPDPPIQRRLQRLRGRLRETSGLAVSSGFGPRFLHSTGQLHKGGANNGLFLQLVNEPDTDLRVPETDYSFSRLIAAQADGDAGALLQTGRRVLRVRLGKRPGEELEELWTAFATH